MTENWLSELKIGDKVLVENPYNDTYSQETVKSVSPQRGDILITSGMKFSADGTEKKIGHYPHRLVQFTAENVAKSNAAKKRIANLKIVKSFNSDFASDELLEAIASLMKQAK